MVNRRFLTVELGNKSLVEELTKFQESPEENTAIERIPVQVIERSKEKVWRIQ